MMRIPVVWLKELVRTSLDTAGLAALLTDLGIEIEGLEDAPAGLGGQVLVAEVTPNRGDCLNLCGLAREVAARTGAELCLPEIHADECADEPLAGRFRVIVQDGDLCPRYSARLVLGVQPGPSPQWMQDRLLACGQRPINILVDVTNYVLFELGQPLHAFDYDLLGTTIGVRRAREGESMTTLDGVERKLSPEHLLITDGSKGVALAGVMGGAGTMCHEGTRNVLLEAAHFHAPNVRRTARTLGLESESSYRFARVVDPGGTVAALDRCAQLLAEYAGGTIAAGVVDVIAQPIDPVTIPFRPSRCNRFLGVDLSLETLAGYLEALGLEVELDGDDLAVTVPTRRPDLTREVDLIEEVARLHGYNSIPMTAPPPAKRTGRLSPRQRLTARVRELLRAAGLNEVWTFSLTSPQAMARAGFRQTPAEVGAVVLENALSTDFSVMRWSMLPSMLEVVARNASQHGGEVRVCELGRTYAQLNPGVTDHVAEQMSRVVTGVTAAALPLPCVEELTLAGAVTGNVYTSAWNLPAESLAADFSQVKGLLDLLVSELGLRGVTVEPCAEPVFEPGRAARFVCGDTLFAVVGEVAAPVLAAYDLRKPVVLFEANLGWMLDHAHVAPSYTPLPRYPAALRDLALVVPDEVPEAEVAQAIRDAAAWLEELRLFDVYRGQGLDGARSLAFGLTFRHPSRTLTDVEIEAVMQAVLAKVEADCGAKLRL